MRRLSAVVLLACLIAPLCGCVVYSPPPHAHAYWVPEHYEGGHWHPGHWS